ncbi:MAG: hypothetical protein QM718_00620 [Steroidobacteraceae bacterium]
MKVPFRMVLLCTALAVSACSNLKTPATQAVASVESSLESVRESAAKYAPEALQSAESQVTSLKNSLAAGNYKDVMAAVPGVTSAISNLSETVTTKKAQLAAAMAQAAEQWKSLSNELPQMLDALQSRVAILSRAKKLPANLDQATFESAKAGLDDFKAGWAKAGDAFASGDALDAVAKAQAIKDKGIEIMRSLGMKAG